MCLNVNWSNLPNLLSKSKNGKVVCWKILTVKNNPPHVNILMTYKKGQYNKSNRINQRVSIIDKSIYEGIHVFLNRRDARYSRINDCNLYSSKSFKVVKVICDLKDLVAVGENSLGGKPAAVFMKVFLP